MAISGGVWSRGVSALGGCLVQGGCLVLGGVCSRGVSAPGGCLLPGGVCSRGSAPGEVSVPGVSAPGEGGCLL